MSLVFDYRELRLRHMEVTSNQDGTGLASDGTVWTRCFMGWVGSNYMWIISD